MVKSKKLILLFSSSSHVSFSFGDMLLNSDKMLSMFVVFPL